MTPLKTLHLFASDYDRPKSIELAHWCLARGADEWTVTQVSIRGGDTSLFEKFDATMKPFYTGSNARRHLTAIRGASFVRSADLWALNRHSLVALAAFLPGGLFGGKSDYEAWIEDPIFYRKGELMLGIVSHESEGLLRVTLPERTMLGKASLPYRSEGCYVAY